MSPGLNKEPATYRSLKRLAWGVSSLALLSVALGLYAYWSSGPQIHAYWGADSFRLSVIAFVAVTAGFFAGLYFTKRQVLQTGRLWRLSEEKSYLPAGSPLEYSVITLDSTGSVSSWNPGAEHMHGYRPQEIIGQNFSRLYSPEEAKQGTPAMELSSAAKAGQVRYDGWRMRKDGSSFWAEVVVTALHNSSGAVLGYTQLTCDATGYKQVEERLRNQLESRTDKAMELDALNKSLAERNEKAIADLLSVNNSLQREVVERQATQSLLHKSETRLRSILNSAMDAIITVDENQHIVLFNSAAAQVFGCPQDEAIGASLDRFIPERFRSAHAEHIQRFGSSSVSWRRMGKQRLVTARRSNGEEFPIEASISKVDEGEKSFFTVILRDVTESVRDREALRQASDKMRELALLADQVREQERRRVARELHDDVAQDLATLNIDISQVKRYAQEDHQLRLSLEQMQSSVTRLILSTRRIAADLRPLILDDLGLGPAIGWLAESFTQRTNVPCEITADPPELQIAEPYATAVFRILQESLSNIAKHAQASKVEASIHFNEGFILLDIRDDGRGFNPDGPHGTDSMGLAGLRERAGLLDGQASIESSPGNGTHVHATIPIPDAAQIAV